MLLPDVNREAYATGKLVADAPHAAIAVEHGCTMVRQTRTSSGLQGFDGSTHFALTGAKPRE